MKRFTSNELNEMILFLNNHLPKYIPSNETQLLLQESREKNYQPLPFSKVDLLMSLEETFQKNRERISTTSQENFYHEYGHVYEALLRNFEFTLLILIDFHVQHVFTKNSQNRIEYSSTPTFTLLSKYSSMSSYHATNATEKDLKLVALGGFKQDFIRKQKKPKQLLESFGIDDCGWKENSDASYIYEDVSKISKQIIYINR